MTLLEKIKVNLDYLLGKANPELYSPQYKSSNLSLPDWQKRWEILNADGTGFIWYGVDSVGNIAKFSGDDSYVPEAYFQDALANNMLQDYFKSLVKPTSNGINSEINKVANGNKDNFGVFIFDEINDIELKKKRADYVYNYQRLPYQVEFIANKYLKVNDLPIEIQKLLEPYHFENLKFIDCSFLDVSKYLYCED